MKKGKFDHLLKYMDKEDVAINTTEKTKLGTSSKDIIDWDAIAEEIEMMYPQAESKLSPELESFLNSIGQGDVDDMDDLLEDEIEDSYIKSEPIVNTYRSNEYFNTNTTPKTNTSFKIEEPPKTSFAKNVLTGILTLLFIGVVLFGLGIIYIFGSAPLETFLPSFWAFAVFGFTFVFLSPVSFILVVIGLFMDSTPSAWLGLLVLLPGIPLMIAQTGIAGLYNVYKKLTV